MFCMSCGAKLQDGTKFCSYCGTRQVESSSPTNVNPDVINFDGKRTFVPAMCPNCSAHMKVESTNKIARCESCGTECLVQDAIKTLNVNGSVHVGNATININGTNIGSLLRRVSIMLEDGNFNGAMAKCDIILDLDPTNGEVYLYMLMANLKCRKRSDLANLRVIFDNNQYFLKAMQYGDDKLKDELIGYLNTIVDRIKTETRAEYNRHENQIRNLRVGDSFYFGNYNRGSLWWKVLSVSDRKALIISSMNVCNLPYHQFGGSVTWKNCTLRKWLNNEFLNGCFSVTERNRILPYNNKIDNKDPIVDRIVLLDTNEAKHYLSAAIPRVSNGWWWLRSKGIFAHYAIIVNSDGSIPFNGKSEVSVSTKSYGGVRPVMWISLD